MSGQRAHPDNETIAEYQAGALASWHVLRRRRVAAHLAGCPDCSATAQRLTRVSMVLAAAPHPAMPPDVAERLTAVLAAQSLDPHDKTTRGRSRRLLAAPGGRRPALVPAAATVVALAAVGLGGYAISQSGGSPAPTAAKPVSGPAISAGSSMHEGINVSPEHVGTGPRIPSYRVVASGTDYLPQTLRAQLGHEMQAAGLSTTAAPAALAGCLTRIGAESSAEFVDLARYQGRKAWVIASAGHAWVTGTSCSALRSDLVATVALSRS
jgi:hypothetical protein